MLGDRVEEKNEFPHDNKIIFQNKIRILFRFAILISGNNLIIFSCPENYSKISFARLGRRARRVVQPGSVDGNDPMTLMVSEHCILYELLQLVPGSVLVGGVTLVLIVVMWSVVTRLADSIIRSPSDASRSADPCMK